MRIFLHALLHVHRCLATPCHTQDSICYYVTSTAGAAHAGGVFTGDTLFVAGCGRFFEGTGAEMHAALSYLATLPPQTVVYDGHEYTKSNLAFAQSVDPKNPALARLEKLITDGVIPAQRTTVGDEKEWNVFMRLDSAPIQCVAPSSLRLPLYTGRSFPRWTDDCGPGYAGKRLGVGNRVP